MAVLVANCPILSDTRNNDRRPENPRQSPVSLSSVSPGCDPTPTGSQEVTGSIPVSSTNEINDLEVETNSANSPVLILVPSWLH